MINPAMLFKLKGAWDTFSNNHPKFPMFLQAVNGRINVDTVLEVSVIQPNGEKTTTNIKITESDMELFNEISKMAK